jgi:signal transduction histidine kinase/ActR/RegA family two-component response regulator
MITEERRRIDALQSYQILDTPSEPTFDRITDLAARAFDMPLACITLIDDRRVWLKAAFGMKRAELSREPGLCLSTIEVSDLHVVPDTLDDPAARGNTVVQGGVRFYAGAPLRNQDDHCLGTLCVMDRRPRQMTAREREILASLGRFAMSEIESRRARLEAQKAQNARCVLEARTQQAQRLESLGTLAGGIAHDFNNLLVGVLGNASAALSMLPPDAPARPVVNRIEEAALRATDLVNELMAYAGRSRLEAAPLDLAELIAETTRLLEAAISTKAALICRFESGLAPIKGDAVQIRQVVMNLITNASDALGGTPGTIHIDVKACRLTGTDDVVARDGVRLPAGEYASLEVADSGCGMDTSTRDQMFEPFFTTRDTGRGLGLAAVSGIVAAHGGAILVDSTPGKGTRISVLFPTTAEQPAATAPAAEAPAATVSSGGITILIVDDEPMVRDVARMMLEAEGYMVRAAQDGRSALEAMEREGAAISAVLLDVSMPDLNGDEVCRRIHEVYPATPVILTSGHSHEVVARDLGTSAPVSFLQKPYRKAQLIQAIRSATQVSG